MKKSIIIFGLCMILLISSLVSAIDIDTCQNLTIAGTYNLNDSIITTSEFCIIIQNDNIILEELILDQQ